MAVKFNGGDELRDAVKSFLTDNAQAVVEALFSGELGDKLAEQVGANAPAEAAAPSVPEPASGSVVYFQNESPSDGITRFYAAVRSPRGWANTSGTSRLRKDASWAEIVKFAGASLQVVRDGSLVEA